MDSQPELEEAQDVFWNSAIENLIKSLGEKALSLSWLHNRSEKRYSYLNNYLAIPSIVLSTVVATIGGIFAGNNTASYASSVVSIVVSVLSTLNSYFLFAKRAEAHRITAISYSKLYLQISIELSLPRSKRQGVKVFLKIVSDQIQRLNEIAPSIPDYIIHLYNKQFSNSYPNVSRPHITNGLEELKVNIEELPTIVAKKEEMYAFEPNTNKEASQPQAAIEVSSQALPKIVLKPPFR